MTVFELLASRNQRVYWDGLSQWFSPEEYEFKSIAECPSYRLVTKIKAYPEQRLADKIYEERVLHVLPLLQDKLVFVVFENQDAKFF
jgi:hypothetical protein